MNWRVRTIPKGTCSIYDDDVWVVERVPDSGDAVLIGTFRASYNAHDCKRTLEKSIEWEWAEAHRKATTRTPAPEFTT